MSTIVEENASLEKLAGLIRLAMGDEAPVTAISAQSRFIEDLGMQSINRLMLLSLLEQECGLSLERHMAQLVELETVGDTMRLIANLTAEH
jgi:acyl carrier protein